MFLVLVIIIVKGLISSAKDQILIASLIWHNIVFLVALLFNTFLS